MNLPSDDAQHLNTAAPPAWRRWVLAGVIAFAVLGSALAFSGYWLLFHPAVFATPQPVIVPRHATLAATVRKLEASRLIRSALALRIYARLTRTDGLLKAGEYEVAGRMSAVEILDLLNSGRVKSFWVTIPEGKWASEIGGYLQPHWPEAADGFAALAAQPARWQGKVYFPLPSNSLEGYLFPDTYLFGKSATAEEIIQGMLAAFEQRCWAAYRAQPPADGRTLHEVVILASLVEAEARVPSERPIIASVYMNRLRVGMPLQCDATVLYALQQRLTRVMNRHLAYPSPFNTYTNPYYTQGLPAGPICNPGADCFAAALHPADTPYFYYVARGDGSHIFSRTGAEHEAAVQRVRGR